MVSGHFAHQLRSTQPVAGCFSSPGLIVFPAKSPLWPHCLQYEGTHVLKHMLVNMVSGINVLYHTLSVELHLNFKADTVKPSRCHAGSVATAVSGSPSEDQEFTGTS